MSSKVKFNVTGLQVIAQSLKKLDDGKFRVQVGIFGDKFARPKDHKKNGPTNAEIGFVHEMGSVARHIPRRSFLLDTFTLHGDKLELALKPAVDKLFKKGLVPEYLNQVGVACVNLVVEAFHTGGWGAWAPNAYSTLLAKLKGPLWRRRQMAAEVLYEGAGHAVPLTDTGQLWQSISSRVVRTS